MDEKNANGEINANESVKQLSDSDAQSVESAAEAREFDVVTEKPAQRQEKKTKNAAKRPSGKQRSETTQVVTKTAVRTLVVLVAALILIFAFYILVFPASSGSFCYTVGMKNTSAWLASRAAKKSGEVDDYYTAFLRAVDAKNWLCLCLPRWTELNSHLPILRISATSLTTTKFCPSVISAQRPTCSTIIFTA